MEGREILNADKIKSKAFFKFNQAIKRPSTRRNYHLGLDQFMILSKLTSYDELAKTDPKKIRDLLENFAIWMNNTQLRFSTANGYLAGVELFLDMNEILYPKKMIRKLLPSSDYIPSGKIPFTTEEVARLLKVTNKLRTIALIHFMASLGMRPAGLEDPVLRMKHLVEIPLGCTAVRIYDESKEGYWGFLTPEATTALKTYHNSRRLNGEKLNDESPVFGINDNFECKRDYYSASNARRTLAALIKRSGIERKVMHTDNKGRIRYDKAINYGFRKRFNKILKINNEVNSNIAEKLMAHKRGLDGVYLEPTMDECFNEFKKAIPDLTIDPTQRQAFAIKQKDEEISELKKLKDRLDRLEEERHVDLLNSMRYPNLQN